MVLPQLGRCPVCGLRSLVLSDGNLIGHPLVERVVTIGYRHQATHAAPRGLCPGSGGLPDAFADRPPTATLGGGS